MNNWKETTLDKVIELIIDHRGLTPKKLGGDWSDFGYRAISAKTIKNGQLVNEYQMNILPEDLYKKWMKEETQYGDIFLTSEAPLGEHMVWKSEEKLVLSQRIFGIRTKKDILDPFFFNYFIDSKYYQHQLKSRESGSTVTGIKQSELLKTKVILPPLPEQKEIAAMLSSFDDKVELLRKENETLEKIAQTIFKEWFVDFTINGEKLKLENGIPEGWRVESVTSVVNIRQGKYLESNEISDFIMGDKKFPIYGGNGIRGYIKDFTYQKPQVVLTCRGNGCGLIQLTRENSTITNSCMTFEYMDSVLSYEFLYFWAKKIGFESVTSGSAQPQITITNLSSLDIIIPDEKILEEFNKSMNSLFEKMFLNNFEIQTLSRSRDTLLPKLMSGEIDLNL